VNCYSLFIAVGCRGLVMASSHKKSDYLSFINNLAPELKSSNFGELNAPKLPGLKYLIRIDNTPTPGMMNLQ